jgi:hypothetical protein
MPFGLPWRKIFFLLAAIALLLPLPFHPRQDYGAYVVPWKLMWSGLDPWIYPNGILNGNAYGPVFNFFAPLFALSPHLPHEIFIAAWLILSYQILVRISSNPTASSKIRNGFFVALMLNPFFWISVVSYGQFDVLIALWVYCSYRKLKEGKSGAAGVWLAIAILLKYYPLILLPFLAIEKKKIDFRFMFTTLGICAASLGISAWIWGAHSVFFPLLFAGHREANFLSIFRFLRSPYSPFPGWDFLSVPLMAVSVFLVLIAHFWFRFDRLYAALCALMVAFFFYKVSHPQFYTFFFFFIPIWMMERMERGLPAFPATWLAWSWKAPMVFVSVTNLLYAATQGFKNRWYWVDDWISIPFFALQIVCLPLWVKGLWLSRKAR